MWNGRVEEAKLLVDQAVRTVPLYVNVIKFQMLNTETKINAMFNPVEVHRRRMRVVVNGCQRYCSNNLQL